MARHSAVAQSPAMQASKFLGIAQTAETAELSPGARHRSAPLGTARHHPGWWQDFGHSRNRRTKNQASTPKNQAA
jgi:hypothetical protein